MDMPNPVEAFGGTGCDVCGEYIYEGDSLFFDDNQKLCEECAGENDNICDCGNYKKSQFDECYECNQEDDGGF